MNYGSYNRVLEYQPHTQHKGEEHAERDYSQRPRNESDTDRQKSKETRGHSGEEEDHEDDKDQSFKGRLKIPYCSEHS